MNLAEIVNDPERRAKAKVDQEKARTKFGHVLSRQPAQANYLFGLAREQAILDSLRHRDSDVFYNRLAEAYALQSRFTEAAEVSRDARYTTEYEAKAQALANVGIRQCECPLQRRIPSARDAKGTLEQTQRLLEQVSDGERVVTLTECRVCGAISAQSG